MFVPVRTFQPSLKILGKERSKCKGKLMCLFSAQRRRISAPRLLDLPTEAWRGAETCIRSAENHYVDLPRHQEQTQVWSV